MTGLALSEDERLFAEAAASLCADLNEGPEDDRAGDWKQLSANGWPGILVSEAHGGLGLGLTHAICLARELGRSGRTSAFVSTAIVGAVALGRADDAGPATAPLQALARGELLIALAVDENRKFGGEISTALVPDADGMRVFGRKSFVIGGDEADLLVVACKAERSQHLVLVHPGDPGVVRRPATGIDGGRYADLSFEGAAGFCLWSGEDAWSAPAVCAAQIAAAAELVGMAEGVFARTIDYLKTRQQFGKPIGSFQALQHRAAHLLAMLELARTAIIAAARAFDNGDADAAKRASLAKVLGNDVSRLAVNEAIQMHGGIGMTQELRLGDALRRQRVLGEWLGDTDFHLDQFARARGY